MVNAFFPGNEWLYFKLHTGIKSTERVLVEIIRPLTEDLLAQKLITSFFFIRYNENGHHIRLRFRLSDNNAFNGVMQAFFCACDEYYRNGLIHNIAIGTYKREIERYGGGTISAVETLFYQDSRTLLGILDKLRESGDNDKTRWLLSMVMIDDLFNAFGLGKEEKIALITVMNDNFSREFGINALQYTKPLNDKYRQNKSLIEAVLKRDGEYLPYKELFYLRNESLQPAIAQILTISGTTGNPSKEELLPSLIHMMMNRIFRSNNRLCEMVVYYLLHKHYVSLAAKEKAINKPKKNDPENSEING